jgi:muramoyltetrapeptide carboxypeptidase
MRTKSWPFLRPGDVVDVIAPASHSPADKLADGVRWIEHVGLVPRVPPGIINTDVFFAAPLEVQLAQLRAAIASDAKAIWCLRGGYGSMRLIPHLLRLRPPPRPKLFVGFSDITALHLFFSQRWNWPVIHGRTISQMHPEAAGTPDRRLLTDVIFGKKGQHTFRKLVPLNAAARAPGTVSGAITGGNLRILQSSLGTRWELETRGKILFIEDVAERGYSVDRMLEQLYQAKLLDRGPKALVLGDFTEGHEKDGRELVSVAIERFAARVPYPVLRGLPAGHDPETNYPVPFNTPCTLTLGRSGRLTCAYGGAL